MSTAVHPTVRLAALRQRINELHNKRFQAADVALEIASQELNRTKLRADLIRELVAGGLKWTPAEDQARADERYLAAGRSIATLSRDLARITADAERLRLDIDIGTTLLKYSRIQAETGVADDG